LASGKVRELYRIDATICVRRQRQDLRVRLHLPATSDKGRILTAMARSGIVERRARAKLGRPAEDEKRRHRREVRPLSGMSLARM